MNYASSNNYFEADVIAEAQGANFLVYYTQGQGLISQRRNNASYFYHYDGLGSTKALTDANQNIQNTTKYDAWGNILQSSGTITNPYLYVGELGYYGDGDAGMYLLTQRWYNPTIGRFVVRDPLPRVKLYLYCNANPIIFVDPKGLMSREECKEICDEAQNACEGYCGLHCDKPAELTKCMGGCKMYGSICRLLCKILIPGGRQPSHIISPIHIEPPDVTPICTLIPSPNGGVEVFCGVTIRF
jgi:RHS repeat-associated protein